MLLALGGAIFSYLCGLKFIFSEDIGGRPLLTTSFFLMIAGFQMITTGILAEVLVRVMFESGQNKSYVVRNLLEQGSRGEATIGIAKRLIINIAAGAALEFAVGVAAHDLSSPSKLAPISQDPSQVASFYIDSHPSLARHKRTPVPRDQNGTFRPL